MVPGIWYRKNKVEIPRNDKISPIGQKQQKQVKKSDFYYI